MINIHLIDGFDSREEAIVQYLVQVSHELQARWLDAEDEVEEAFLEARFRAVNELIVRIRATS